MADFIAPDERIRRKAHLYDTPQKILWGLLFALSETVADRVEAVGTDLEQLSKNIAEMPTELGTGKTGTMTEISELLAELSRYEDFISQSGESVLQLARVVRYFNAEVDGFTDAEVLRGYIAARSPLKVADYQPGDDVVRQ